MATYTELRDLFARADFLNRLDIAVLKAAQAQVSGTPTAAQQKWASAVLANPRGEGEKAWRYVLAVNSAATLAVIEAATDGGIQTQVDLVVPTLVAAYSA